MKILTAVMWQIISWVYR